MKGAVIVIEPIEIIVTVWNYGLVNLQEHIFIV